MRRSGATFGGTALVFFFVCVLFVYACAGVLELNLLRHLRNDIRVQCEINTERCQKSLLVPVSLPREEDILFVRNLLLSLATLNNRDRVKILAARTGSEGIA